MRYGSICSGIEAASAAWHPLGWTPAFFAEVEKFPSAVLAHHYGSNMPGEALAGNGVPNLGDITKFQEWPDAAINVLVGGTPCQSFSVAGLRKGLTDPRGNLALTYLAIADRYRPRWVVWENVPGVLSSWSSDVSPDDLQEGEEREVVETSDFGCFLEGLRQLGYGFAYRVLDAQFVRVDGFARAVPQRRRRVFVVGYLGDWRRAAAVLFERESLLGHPAPRRQTGQGVASPIASGSERGSGYRNDADTAENLIAGTLGQRTTDHRNGMKSEADFLVSVAFGGNRQSGALDVATAVNAHGGPHGRLDFESETFVCAPPLTGNPYGDHESREGLLIAHSLRAEGFDASEDGTGRGTPLVPIAFDCKAGGDTSFSIGEVPGALRGEGHGGGHAAIAFDTTQITSAGNYSQPKAGDPCHPLAAGAHPPAVAIQAGALRENPTSGPDGVGVQADIGYTLEARAEVQAVQTGWAVRRLTPLECERLQGFPDGYTDILWRGKPAADGPRYKALGNSMAVNCMRWLGQRIEMVERLDAVVKRDAA